MTSVHEFWAPIWNAFDPYKPLQVDQMDRWYVERPHSPLRALQVDLSPDRAMQHALIFGHRSSGKTTELTCLAAKLAADFHQYFVVWVDVSENTSNIDRVTQADVLFLMGAALYKLAKEALSKHPDAKSYRALTASLESLVRETTTDKTYQTPKDNLDNLVCFAATLAGGAVAGPLGAYIVGQSVRTASGLLRFDSTLSVKDVRRREVAEPRLRDIVTALNFLIADVSTANKVEVLFLVDGLDRIRDMETAEFIFATDAEWLDGPACRAVYTTPVFLSYSPVFGQVRNAFPCYPFPNVRVHAPHQGPDVPGEPDKEGYETMRRVVRRRLAAPPLSLDPDEAITPAALDVLVQGSAGILREIVGLMRRAVTEAELADRCRIGEEIAWEAVYALRRDLSAALNSAYRQILLEVLKTHDAPTASPQGAELLLGNYALSYRNRHLWYDVHSALLPLLK